MKSTLPSSAFAEPFAEALARTCVIVFGAFFAPTEDARERTSEAEATRTLSICVTKWRSRAASCADGASGDARGRRAKPRASWRDGVLERDAERDGRR